MILQHFTIIPQRANRTLLSDSGSDYKPSQMLTSAELDSSVSSESLCIHNLHRRIMFALCVGLLLGVASVGCSSSLPCEDLTRPLDQLGPDLFVGRWAFVAAGLSNPVHEEKFQSRDSASFVFVNGTSGLQLTRSVSSNGTCQYTRSVLTPPEGGRFNYITSNITLSVLRTSCPDCLVFHSHRKSDDHQHVYLFSRRRDVKKEEMEEFESQVNCFKITRVVQADPTKELCPDDI